MLPEAVLPEAVLRLPEELARVDTFLNDPVFFVPFVPFYDPGWADRPRRGRSACG